MRRGFGAKEADISTTKQPSPNKPHINARMARKCKNSPNSKKMQKKKIPKKNKIDPWSGVNMLAFFRIFLVPPFCQDRMVDWIPSEGRNPF